MILLRLSKIVHCILVLLEGVHVNLVSQVPNVKAHAMQVGTARIVWRSVHALKSEWRAAIIQMESAHAYKDFEEQNVKK